MAVDCLDDYVLGCQNTSDFLHHPWRWRLVIQDHQENLHGFSYDLGWRSASRFHRFSLPPSLIGRPPPLYPS